MAEPTTKAATAKTKHANLATALAAFQADLPKVTKTATADTGKYDYSYAPLEVLAPIVLAALSKNGIAYVAAPHLRDDGNFVLRAKLVHETGEEFGGDYPLGNPGAPAQAIGSAISYARRYALLSLTGVAPEGEDDDGKSAAPAAGATKQAEAKAGPPKETIQAVREELSAIINDDSNEIDGNAVNDILKEIAGADVDPGKWTLTVFQKGRDKIKAQIAAKS